MPQLLKHIDMIAREKQRDVLLVQFHNPEWKEEEFSEFLRFFSYEKSEARKEILAWLTANDIAFLPCGEVASECLMASYLGQIYIDVPYDEKNPLYQKIRDFLENPDGSMKIPGAFFCVLPLSVAMKNTHHDEPGFWEKWAENF